MNPMMTVEEVRTAREAEREASAESTVARVCIEYPIAPRRRCDVPVREAELKRQQKVCAGRERHVRCKIWPWGALQVDLEAGSLEDPNWSALMMSMATDAVALAPPQG